jgi:hypothetical protein
MDPMVDIDNDKTTIPQYGNLSTESTCLTKVDNYN